MHAPAELSSALAGRYRMEREVGRGAAAVVYLAREIKHDRDVAIKVLHADLASELSAERFLREIRISAGLQHPHILSLHDSGEAAGLIYCVMPFVEGETLRDRLRREKALPIDATVRIVRQVAEALTYAHERGVVHRDIKPENILLANDQAFVSDFGVARALVTDTDERLTQTGFSLGTVAYMSPEQAAGDRDADHRSDIYSLGCMMYEMLAGEPPFSGPNPQSVIARHLQQPAPSVRILRQTVPEHIDDAILRALAKAPQDRFPTAAAFADAVEAAGTGAHHAPGVAAPSRRWARMLPIAVVAAVGALAVREAWSRWMPARLDTDLVAIAPFDATDSTLGVWKSGVQDLLARNLNGAGPLRVVPPSVVVSNWAGRADEASAVRLGRRTDARSVVVGAVYRRGADSVRLTAAMFDASSHRLLGDVETIVPTGRMERGADSLTVAILTLVGRERPIGSARPPSSGPNAMAALKAYLQGEVYYRRTVWDSAQIFFERAAQIDTNYALAFHRLAFVRSMLGSGLDSLIWFHGLHAGRLSRGLPQRDSLVVTIDSLRAALFHVTATAAATSTDSTRESLHSRLFETLAIANRRFPDDAELWYIYAVQLLDWGDRVPGKTRLVLNAVNRTLALDSAFLPAYSRAINLAAVLDGQDAARRYIKAYLARHPTGTAADAARLDEMLFDPARAGTAETARALAAAPARVLLTAWSPLLWWYDSAETAARVTQRIVSHPDAARLDPRVEYPNFLHAVSLASRGHARTACATMLAVGMPQRLIFPQLAELDCLPRDSAAALIVQLAARERWQPSRVAMFVSWWSAVGDTARLVDQRRRGDSIVRAPADVATRAAAQFLAESARAYLALARHDTTEALARFQNAPDSLCRFCTSQRVAKARLLDARGQTRQAIAVLSENLDDDFFPFAFIARLQRARHAEKVGDRQAAILDYTRVADAWERGDPALRDSARVARAALQRLATAR